MALIPKSTAYTRSFLMISSTDHISPLTGATVTVTLSKAGGAFAAAGGTITEVANGWYKIALTTTDTGTAGDLAFHCTATGGDNTDFVDQVGVDGSNSTNAGLSALPATAVTTNASLLTSGTGTDQLSVTAGKVLLQATQAGVTIPTVTNVTNQLTAAAIATGLWQDTTAGDFTVASSIGKSLYTSGVVPGAAGGLFIAGANATTTVNITGTISTVTTVTNQLTGAAIAAAVWQDQTAGDFTKSGSAGNVIVTQLGGAFTSGSSSVLTTAALQNAPGGTSSGPSAAAIATALWQDLVASGDFTRSGSIGSLLVTAIPNATAGAAGGLFIAGANATTTVNFTGNLSGSVGSVTGGVGSVTGSVGSVIGGVGSVTGSVGSVVGGAGSVTGSVGSIAGINFPGNFAATLIDAGGHVTANSVTGSVGSIAGVTFPANFAATLIDSGGHVTANSVTGSVGSIAGITFPTHFSIMTIDASGFVTANSVTGSVGSIATNGITNFSFAANSGLQPVRVGTAQAGGSSTITLDSGASATSLTYVGLRIYLTGGTGVGQSRIITSYTGSSKVAGVQTNWLTVPDNTTTFALLSDSVVDVEAIGGMGTSTNSAMIGVNIVNIKGISSQGTPGYVGLDWAQILNANATAILSSTTIGSIAGVIFPNNFAATLIDSGGHVTANSVTGSIGSVVSGVALLSSGLDAVVIEAGLNARQAISIIISSVAGVLAGAATTAITIAAAGNPATNRIAATVDINGNRTAVTLAPPA